MSLCASSFFAVTLTVDFFAQFLEDLIQAYSDLDMHRFADICYDMDNAVKFDFWELTMLRRIKRGLQVCQVRKIVDTASDQRSLSHGLPFCCVAGYR